MIDKDQRPTQGTDQGIKPKHPHRSIMEYMDAIEQAAPADKAARTNELIRAIDPTGQSIKQLAEEINRTAKIMQKVQPFLDAIFEAYPVESWFMYQSIGAILSPIGAFMQDRGLHDGADMDAHKADFLAFFQAYISEMETAYKEDPGLDLEAVQRAILGKLQGRGLIKEESAAAAEQQTMTIIEGYNLMSQGPLVHEFMKKAKIRPGNFTVDELTGSMRIEEDGLITLIENNASLRGGLKDTTKRFLLVMLCENTKQGRKSDTITLPLQSFMDMCGLKDLKAARQQIVDDMETLYSISLSASSGGSKRRGGDFTNIRLCSKQEIKNGVITFRMGQDFYEMARKWSIMPYPESAFKLNLKYNPHGQNIALTLARHKYANKGKANETLISVRSLLAACPGIPRYEDIAQAGQLTKRIIDPFERDMDALLEVGALASWEYCHSKGGPIKDDELAGGWTYDLFSSLLIQFDMDGYPDQMKRLASRARYAKAAAKRKSAGKKTASKRG